MHEDFINTLKKETPDYGAMFQHLYKEVIALNKMIGLEDVDHWKLIDSYEKLLQEEIKEVKEAIEKEDKYNLVKELIDVLVVGGYLYYLQKGHTFDCYNEGLNGSFSLNEDLSIILKEQPHFAALEVAQSSLVKMGCDLEKAINEVLASNISKFPTEFEMRKAYWDENLESFSENKPTCQIVKFICSQIEDEGRYSGVHCKTLVDGKGETRYSFWCTHEYGVEKFKYLKSQSYKDADMREVW